MNPDTKLGWLTYRDEKKICSPNKSNGSCDSSLLLRFLPVLTNGPSWTVSRERERERERKGNISPSRTEMLIQVRSRGFQTAAPPGCSQRDFCMEEEEARSKR